ncbi:hypothetical protein HK097_007909 [Rhizophlyctis rosea]|uniref:Secreted protein n=1 Tax=Rhizophlyctis rosea TaxID=64517 RepID=A0AAD5SE47_9FUNG|nr:hypothetical protein HK097_007909 [Rhizophlyctis rosea]
MYSFVIIFFLATIHLTRPSPVPLKLPWYPEPKESYLYSYNYRAYRGAAIDTSSEPVAPVAPIAVVPLKKVENHKARYEENYYHREPHREEKWYYREPHYVEKYYPTPKKHITYAGADKGKEGKKEEEGYDDKYWTSCKDAHVHAWKVGSPTLYQCAAIACTKNQSSKYRDDTLKYCGNLEKEARKGGKSLKGW